MSEKASDFIPKYWQHCTKVPSKEACPAEAISKNEQGIFLIYNDFCIGCEACIEAYPFRIIQFDDNQEIAVKCDLCVEKRGNEETPACTMVCPTRRIFWGDPEDFPSGIGMGL